MLTFKIQIALINVCISCYEHKNDQRITNIVAPESHKSNIQSGRKRDAKTNEGILWVGRAISKTGSDSNTLTQRDKIKEKL